jgi:dienelactone hydrolase
MRRFLTLVIGALSCVAAGAQPAGALTAESVFRGSPIQISADLAKPPGAGPFPTVILLPGCAPTIDAGLPSWAGLLRQWGYATVYAHDLSARGYFDVCSDGKLSIAMAAEMRTDVYSLAEAIASQPALNLRADKIAVLGRSFGSMTVVNYVAADLPPTEALKQSAAAHGARIVAGVAISPSCYVRSAIVMPVLILTGALDDWTGPSLCVDLARANPGTVQIKMYPDAYHSFDRPGAPTSFLGHRIEYNATDTQDAYGRVRDFLAPLLR